MSTTAPVDIFTLSDEQIMQMTAPPSAPAGAVADTTGGESESTPPVTTEPTDTVVETPNGEAAAETTDTPEGTDTTATTENPDGGESTTTSDTVQPTSDDKTAEGKTPSESKDGVTTPPGSTKGAATVTDYEAFYKLVMAPFNANGKQIQLKDPQEVIQLMQQGANYTRKMQAIAPHRKILMMLDNNGLLDESKLSYLIDLDKKNPEAVKKLIKESGLDVREIDTEAEPAYKSGNHHAVSDEEANLKSTLEELSATERGRETVKAINEQWDQASKTALWSSPELLKTIHQQRENGIYELVTTEMERLRLLGQIAPNVPFIQAYKLVGDQLDKSGAFEPLIQKQLQTMRGNAPAVSAVTPVAVTTPAPKSVVANGDKASAASPTRTVQRTAKPIVNPLAMSDDEFMKQAGLSV